VLAEGRTCTTLEFKFHPTSCVWRVANDKALTFASTLCCVHHTNTNDRRLHDNSLCIIEEDETLLAKRSHDQPYDIAHHEPNDVTDCQPNRITNNDAHRNCLTAQLSLC
jgi:hypothetical protein